jgi:hypothetical protein
LADDRFFLPPRFAGRFQLEVPNAAVRGTGLAAAEEGEEEHDDMYTEEDDGSSAGEQGWLEWLTTWVWMGVSSSLMWELSCARLLCTSPKVLCCQWCAAEDLMDMEEDMPGMDTNDGGDGSPAGTAHPQI